MSAATHTHRYLTRLFKATEILQKATLIEAALMLTYAGIDQMSWLTHPAEETGGPEFKAWADGYLDLRAVGCTSNDLWGARCGLLHTAAAESRDFRNNKAKLVHYIDGALAVTENADPNVVVIHATQLFTSFVRGAVRSVCDCENDPTKLASLEAKASRALAWQPYPHLEDSV
jgi:hypothetical protein